MSATTPPFAPPPSGPGSGRPVGPPSSPGGPAVAPGGRPGALSTESRLPKLAPATLAGQAAAFAVCVLAVGLLCAWLDQPVAFIVAVGVLAAGIAVGLTTGVGLRFTNAAGWVLGLLATVLMIMALGILHALTDLRLPWALSVLVGLFIVGLDWLYVQRLRGAVVLSGLFVVPLLAEGKGGETAAALVWFGGALVAFWLLERDGRAVVPTAEPVGGEGSTPSRGRVADLLGIIGPALLIGLVAAMLIGNPSCSGSTPPVSSSSSVPRFGSGGSGSGGSGQSSQFGQSSSDQEGSSSPSSVLGQTDGQGGGEPGGSLFRLDRNGHEQSVEGNSAGGGTITAPSGEAYAVTSEGGQTVVRDAGGNVVARLDGDEVVAGSPGDTQHYQIDEQGRVFLRGTDGTRYDLDERAGELVLVDPDGNVVSSAPLGADHLYAHDPDGNVLVPGGRGDGGIPVPNQAVREGLLGQGKTYSTDGAGNPVVSGTDGSTHTYGTDADGNPQVRVDDGHGQVRTYVYESTDGRVVVRQLDQDGHELHRYQVDPAGSFVEGRNASGAGPSAGADPQAPTPEAAAGRAGAPTEVASHRSVNWLLVAVLALVAALAVAAVVWWLRRRSTPPSERSWAEGLVRQLDREGAGRGRPRRAGETVVAYAAALSDGPLADPRLTTVGRVLSDALFGRTPPSPELQAWTEEALSEIVGLHPVPRWTDRFRRGAAPSPAA